MQKLLAVCLLTAGLAAAQQTRREETKSISGAEDSRPNNPNVPDVYAIKSQFDRVVVLRFKYQTDVLAGMEKMVKEQNIKNAVILSGIGSVRNYQVHVVSNRTMPSKNLFVKDPAKPADVLNMNGYVIDGVIHAHIALADGDKAFGGHLEPGTNVFTFVAVTLGVFADGADLKRLDDKTYR